MSKVAKLYFAALVLFELAVWWPLGHLPVWLKVLLSLAAFWAAVLPYYLFSLMMVVFAIVTGVGRKKSASPEECTSDEDEVIHQYSQADAARRRRVFQIFAHKGWDIGKIPVDFGAVRKRQERLRQEVRGLDRQFRSMGNDAGRAGVILNSIRSLLEVAQDGPYAVSSTPDALSLEKAVLRNIHRTISLQMTTLDLTAGTVTQPEADVFEAINESLCALSGVRLGSLGQYRVWWLLFGRFKSKGMARRA